MASNDNTAAQHKGPPKRSKVAGWNTFARFHAKKPRGPWVKKAVTELAKSSAVPRVAIDLGSGPGGNALFLLRAGFDLHAVDSNALALQLLRSRAKKQAEKLKALDVPPPALKTHRTTMRNFTFPKAGLIVALKSLPFETKAGFRKVLRTIPRSLAKGGVLLLHLFGSRDTWVKSGAVQALSKKELTDFLRNFRVITIKEKEMNRRGVLGPVKHWHDIYVIAMRR